MKKLEKKTPQEKIELSNKKLADNSAEFNKDKSMQNNTNANSKEQNFTSSQGNDSQIKTLKFKVNALANHFSSDYHRWSVWGLSV